MAKVKREWDEIWERKNMEVKTSIWKEEKRKLKEKEDGNGKRITFLEKFLRGKETEKKILG